jgi:hypothetical protein
VIAFIGNIVYKVGNRGDVFRNGRDNREVSLRSAATPLAGKRIAPEACHRKEAEMRRTVWTVSMLIAVVALGASSLSAAGMTFGVKGGLNVTKLTGDLMNDAKWRMVGVGGAFLCYKISDVFAIQPEMLFAMKGTKWEAATEEGNATYTWKLNYLEIPLLAKVYVPTQSKLKPHVYAGPALDLDRKSVV